MDISSRSVLLTRTWWPDRSAHCSPRVFTSGVFPLSLSLNPEPRLSFSHLLAWAQSPSEGYPSLGGPPCFPPAALWPWGFVGAKLVCFSLRKIPVKKKKKTYLMPFQSWIYSLWFLSSFPLKVVGFAQHPVGRHSFERFLFDLFWQSKVWRQSGTEDSIYRGVRGISDL